MFMLLRPPDSRDTHVARLAHSMRVSTGRSELDHRTVIFAFHRYSPHCLKINIAKEIVKQYPSLASSKRVHANQYVWIHYFIFHICYTILT